MDGMKVGQHESVTRVQPSGGDMKSAWFFKVLLFRRTLGFGAEPTTYITTASFLLCLHV